MATLYEQWKDLIENQTEETFEAFWKEYSETETRIYKDLLARHTEVTKGTFKELAEKYEADPVIFMGFLDGIDTSLKASNDFKTFDENSEIVLDIDFEKLFFNMLAAEAQYLYTLEEWEDVLDEVKRIGILQAYKKSKIVVREQPKVGRNDPCPCGSGKKYKKCCGANK